MRHPNQVANQDVRRFETARRHAHAHVRIARDVPPDGRNLKASVGVVLCGRRRDGKSDDESSVSRISSSMRLSDQLGVGIRSTESTTATSIGTGMEASRRPICSRSAVKIDTSV